jgi:hypothetical protein
MHLIKYFKQILNLQHCDIIINFVHFRILIF